MIARRAVARKECGFLERKTRPKPEAGQKNYRTLRDMGWRVIIIWECEFVNATEKVVDELKLAKPPHQRKRFPRDNAHKS